MPKFLANIDMEQNRIEDLPTPLVGSEAANKAYVDAVASGLDAKASVRAVAVGNISLAAPGAAIDGVSLSANDRVLLAGQTNPVENGIWQWNGAASALTRTADADAAGELSGGTYVFVEGGSTYSDSGWVITTDGSITPGTTSHAWTQFTGAGALVAGAGLTKTGNTFDVGAGSGITVGADSIGVDSTVARRDGVNIFTAPQTIDLGSIGNPLALDIHASGSQYIAFSEGGVARGSIKDLADQIVIDGAAGVQLMTGAGNLELLPAGDIDCNAKRLLDVAVATTGTDGLSRTAGDARYPRKTAVNCAAATTTVVNHAFNTRDVVTKVIRNSAPWDEVEADIEATDANNVTVRFAVAPAASAYRIVVMA